MREAVQDHVVADVDDGGDLVAWHDARPGRRASGRPRRRRTGPPARSEHRSAAGEGRSGLLVPSPPAMPTAHPAGPALDGRVRPARGGPGQRRRRGLRRARRRRRSAARSPSPNGTEPPTAWPATCRARRPPRATSSACSCRRASTTPCSTPPCNAWVPSRRASTPAWAPGEVASVLERAAPVLMVVDHGRGRASRARAGVPQVTRAEVGGRLDRRAAPAPWPEPGRATTRWPSCGPAGRPARPKGALFDHANLAAVARGTDVLSQPGDRRLSPLPFAHVGYMTRAWDEIAHGVTTVITPTPWRADDAVRIMAAGAASPSARACRRSGRSCWPPRSWPSADLSFAPRRRHGRGAHERHDGRRDAQALRRAGRRPLHLDRSLRSGPAPR